MKLHLFGWLAFAEACCLAVLVVGDHLAASRLTAERRANVALVEQLALTDLALWTEARYTRHPSQADMFSAFQDGLAAMEHFPAGALVPPPELPRRVSDAARSGTADDPSS